MKFIGSAKHGQCVTRVNRAVVSGVHFRLMVMADQHNAEMIVIFKIADSLVYKGCILG
jgi:hypothetical protein